MADGQLLDPTESPMHKHLHTCLTHTLASRDRNKVQGLEVTDEINHLENQKGLLQIDEKNLEEKINQNKIDLRTFEINLENSSKLLEKNIGKKAKIKFKPLQDGDVIETSADTTLLKDWIGYNPDTEIELGLK